MFRKARMAPRIRQIAKPFDKREQKDARRYKQMIHQRAFAQANDLIVHGFARKPKRLGFEG